MVKSKYFGCFDNNVRRYLENKKNNSTHPKTCWLRRR